MPQTARLFLAYHAQLVRYLTRRLGDADWAEDVAQETFVRAGRQRALVHERAWIFAVASNLVRDEARRDIRRRQHLTLWAVDEADRREQTGEVDHDRARVQSQEAHDVRRALDTLTPQDRQALLLRGEGLDYPEIATILSVAVGSVGTTLSRARRRLADAYDHVARQHSLRGTHGAS